MQITIEELASSIISPTELEDFQAALRSAGQPRADFQLFSVETPLPERSLVPMSGGIKITNIKTNITRTYRAGLGTAWPAQFGVDLHNGMFGAC